MRTRRRGHPPRRSTRRPRSRATRKRKHKKQKK
jgi:hypothetical protein